MLTFFSKSSIVRLDIDALRPCAQWSGMLPNIMRASDFEIAEFLAYTRGETVDRVILLTLFARYNIEPKNELLCDIVELVHAESETSISINRETLRRHFHFFQDGLLTQERVDYPFNTLRLSYIMTGQGDFATDFDQLNFLQPKSALLFLNLPMMVVPTIEQIDAVKRNLTSEDYAQWDRLLSSCGADLREMTGLPYRHFLFHPLAKCAILADRLQEYPSYRFTERIALPVPLSKQEVAEVLAADYSIDLNTVVIPSRVSYAVSSFFAVLFGCISLMTKEQVSRLTAMIGIKSDYFENTTMTVTPPYGFYLPISLAEALIQKHKLEIESLMGRTFASSVASCCQR